MTDQEIFDTVATHLFQQGHRAFNGLMCCYRAPNGDKCAVGCLIPDEEYDPDMETRPAMTLARRGFRVRWQPSQDGLITALQRVHDKSANWYSERHLYDALDAVAINFGLSSDRIPRKWN